ncbi:YncE family protein [Cognatitamlana onchidii]|uniref:YncE family protein n=1 Tax=Cognatitamlana onchidii TaxID=2562860 RepID=UPI0010A61975|nr:ATP-binding protein [Algibacter onchidii]
MNYKYQIVLCLGVFFFVSCGKRKTVTNAKPEEKTAFKPTLELLWKTDTLLTTSESVLYDPVKDIIYVSNVNNSPWDKDGNGFISTINTKGEITNLKWMEGLSGPKGMGIHNGKLYVNDIDRVVEIDIEKQKVTNEFFVEGNPQLNDITVGNGSVYISGSGSDAIYKIVDNEITEVAKDSLGRLNGLLHQKEGIYYATSASHNFGLYNRDSKTFNTLVSGIGHGDGVVRLDNNDFIVSSWQGQIFYINGENWTKTLILDTRDHGMNAADIDYIPSNRTLLVPTFFDNRVLAYKVNYK